VVEMNAGQMLEDVRLAVEGRCPVRFYGRMGGVIPLPDEILPELERLSCRLQVGGYRRTEMRPETET
jgi:2-oxoglutarate ferredoxin oxidoreductase subunit alpha